MSSQVLRETAWKKTWRTLSVFLVCNTIITKLLNLSRMTPHLSTRCSSECRMWHFFFFFFCIIYVIRKLSCRRSDACFQILVRCSSKKEKKCQIEVKCAVANKFLLFFCFPCEASKNDGKHNAGIGKCWKEAGSHIRLCTACVCSRLELSEVSQIQRYCRSSDLLS